MSRGFYNKCSIVDYNSDYADYVFDNIGNRLSTTNSTSTNDYTANSLNQYSDIDGTNLTYDADGNMLSKGVWTYTWNGENRLISASNGATVVTMAYDYMGRRFEKTVDGDETTFIYDGWNMIRESSSTETNHYVWGLDLSGTLRWAGGIGGLLSVVEDDGASYYPSIDANGNITSYINSNGTVVALHVFDAFGGIIASSKDKADDFKFRFSSKYQDSETSFNYYGYRYYDAEMGRWLNRDPIGTRGGLNAYGFVRNRVVIAVDDLGNQEIGHKDFKDEPPSHFPTECKDASCDASLPINTVPYQDKNCCEPGDSAGPVPQPVASDKTYPPSKTVGKGELQVNSVWTCLKLCMYDKKGTCIAKGIASASYVLSSEVVIWTTTEGADNLDPLPPLYTVPPEDVPHEPFGDMREEMREKGYLP